MSVVQIFTLKFTLRHFFLLRIFNLFFLKFCRRNFSEYFWFINRVVTFLSKHSNNYFDFKTKAIVLTTDVLMHNTVIVLSEVLFGQRYSNRASSFELDARTLCAIDLRTIPVFESAFYSRGSRNKLQSTPLIASADIVNA